MSPQPPKDVGGAHDILRYHAAPPLLLSLHEKNTAQPLRAFEESGREIKREHVIEESVSESGVDFHTGLPKVACLPLEVPPWIEGVIRLKHIDNFSIIHAILLSITYTMRILIKCRVFVLFYFFNLGKS